MFEQDWNPRLERRFRKFPERSESHYLDAAVIEIALDEPRSIGDTANERVGYFQLMANRIPRTSEAYRTFYLQSPEWKARAAAYRELMDNTCENCGRKGGGFDVHHLTYDHFGAEPDEDLELRCRACHNEEHPN